VVDQPAAVLVVAPAGKSHAQGRFAVLLYEHCRAFFVFGRVEVQPVVDRLGTHRPQFAAISDADRTRADFGHLFPFERSAENPSLPYDKFCIIFRLRFAFAHSLLLFDGNLC